MGELIERQAAIDAIQNNVEPFVMVEPGTTCLIGAGVKDSDVIRELEKLPSAQPEIIRCKDCKHWTVGQKGKPWKSEKRYCNRSVTMCVNENDFCSMAEMRVNDESN